MGHCWQNGRSESRALSLSPRNVPSEFKSCPGTLDGSANRGISLPSLDLPAWLVAMHVVSCASKGYTCEYTPWCQVV